MNACCHRRRNLYHCPLRYRAFPSPLVPVFLSVPVSALLNGGSPNPEFALIVSSMLKSNREKLIRFGFLCQQGALFVGRGGSSFVLLVRLIALLIFVPTFDPR